MKKKRTLNGVNRTKAEELLLRGSGFHIEDVRAANSGEESAEELLQRNGYEVRDTYAPQDPEDYLGEIDLTAYEDGDFLFGRAICVIMNGGEGAAELIEKIQPEIFAEKLLDYIREEGETKGAEVLHALPDRLFYAVEDAIWRAVG